MTTLVIITAESVQQLRGLVEVSFLSFTVSCVEINFVDIYKRINKLRLSHDPIDYNLIYR